MAKTRRFNWRDQNDPERDELEAQACATVNDDDSLTQQHHAEAADINVLAKRFGLDKGPMQIVPIDPRYYGDFTNVPDLRTALELVNDATNRFMELDPKLRARFHNKAGELWDFVNDPENADQAVKLGLLQRPPDPTTTTPLDGVSPGT